MKEVTNQIGGFNNDSFYYEDNVSMYTHEKYWSNLVDNGFVGKSFGLGKKD